MSSYNINISLIADTALEFDCAERFRHDIIRVISGTSSIWDTDRRRKSDGISSRKVLFQKSLDCDIIFSKPPGEIVHYRKSVQKLQQETSSFCEKDFRLPGETVFDIILKIDDSQVTEKQVVEFFHKNVYRFCEQVNWGSVKLGKNTTLGCGLCRCLDACLTCDAEAADPMLEESLHFDVNEARRMICIEVDAHDLEGIFVRDKLKKNGSETAVQNGAGDYYIPASTWKGIFRRRCREILAYRKESHAVLDFMFGNYDMGLKGCLTFYDTPISDVKEIVEYRNHIDKFTGGAIPGDWHKNSFVSGSIRLRIEILNNMEPFVQETVQLVMKVITDIQCRRINVGGGFGTGKGFFEITHVRIKDWKQKEGADIFFQEKRIEDPLNLLKQYGIIRTVI